MRAPPLGLAALVAALALDQAAKFVAIRYFQADSGAPFALGPFINVTLRWNRGISQETATGRGLLLAVTAGVALVLAVWLWRARSKVVALGLGAIMGGAIGNGYDRFIYGAVADFLDLHLADWHFFVFNIADAAITVGVAALVLDGLFLTHEAGSASERP